MTDAVGPVGTGWHFPPTFSLQTVCLSSDDQLIREHLWILLGTAQGERVMNPEYGCDLQRFLLREAGTPLFEEIKAEVVSAIRRWERLVELEEVEVAEDPETPGRLDIICNYRIARTNSRSNFVYPFYLGGADPA